MDSYPWESLGPAHVVDVGGSQGSISIALARQFPSLRFTVQDTIDVVELGSENLPADLEYRVSFLAHNFFEEQPVVGADVYFFRWIFHDWSDKYCISILQNLIPALKPGARILVNEFCMPESKLTPYKENVLR